MFSKPIESTIESTIKIIKRNQPVAWTGWIRHVGIFLSNPFVDKRLQINKDSGENSIAIYCIHGTFDNPAAFALIATRLKEKGLPRNISAIHLVEFSKRRKGIGINDFAQQLIATVKANGHRRIILLGHSRGGLVAAVATEEHAADNNIEVCGVFAISSPFKGSHLAVAPLAAVSKSVKEMQYQSSFLAELKAKVIKSKIPYYFFSAEKDNIVWPSCCHPYPTDQVGDNVLCFGRHDHPSILSSHRLVDYLSSIIDQVAYGGKPLQSQQVEPSAQLMTNR